MVATEAHPHITATAEPSCTTPSPEPGTPWYVCMTKPRQERLAEQRLLEQGYEVYLPALPQWKRGAQGWQCTPVVMFPRYAFVRPGRPGQSIAPVRSTPGVTCLVSFGPVVGCVPAHKMHALRHVVAQRTQATPGAPLAPGDAIVFAQGPLKGCAGLVSHVASERVTVMLGLLGREQAVHAAAAELVLA
jgi:transcriptional antiterminator RfaH